MATSQCTEVKQAPFGAGEGIARLVVVEAGNGNLAVLRLHLARMNDVAEVLCFDVYKEALEHIAAQPPTLVLLDLGDSLGLESVKHVREASPSSAIVVLAENEDEVTALHAIRLGAQDFLDKSTMRFHQLVRAVHAALERKRLEQQLEDMSRMDSLTGLVNRAQFAAKVTQSLARARRHNEMFAVLFVDLDGFKPINDHVGHHAGDLALVEVGRRLRAQVREYDTVARLGGDEFAVLLEGIESPESTGETARRIVANIGLPIMANGNLVNVGASVGIAVFPFSGDSMESILNAADRAMYAAKRAGRNTFRFDDPRTLVLESLASVRTDVQEALRRDEFALYFQPQFDLNSNALIGFEALLRWRRNDGTVLAPGGFLPALRGTRLGKELSEWVFCEGLRHLSKWSASGLDGVGLSLNMCVDDLSEKGCLMRVARAGQALGVELSRVEIELAESDLLSDIERGKAVCANIKGAGFRLAISNFGQAGGSLRFLSDVLPDVVKVAPKDVQVMEGQRRVLATFVPLLAHALAIACVAEGIESEEQLCSANARGYDRAQGFYLGGPTPLWSQSPRVIRRRSGPRQCASYVDLPAVAPALHRIPD